MLSIMFTLHRRQMKMNDRGAISQDGGKIVVVGGPTNSSDNGLNSGHVRVFELGRNGNGPTPKPKATKAPKSTKKGKGGKGVMEGGRRAQNHLKEAAILIIPRARRVPNPQKSQKA